MRTHIALQAALLWLASAALGAPGLQVPLSPVAITGATTGVVGTLYQTNTTSSAFTLTLPAAPADGTTLCVVDQTGTWDSNNLTVARGGSDTIEAATSITLSEEYGGVCLSYDVTTAAWIAEYDPDLVRSDLATSAGFAGVVSDERGGGKVAFTDVVVSDKTGAYTVTADDCRQGVLTNNGAGGAFTFTLPADPPVGLTCVFWLADAQDVDVDAAGAQGCSLGAACDRILADTDQNGEFLSSDAIVGSSLTLVSITSSEWFVAGKRGTWTQQ